MNNETDVLVSVIAVTCGIRDYVFKCVESLKAQTYASLELIVIDNSCDPVFAARIRESFPSVRVYSNAENKYYGAALNKGIDVSHGDYVLCLNDDTVLDADFIRCAVHGFSAGNKIGMVSGKILRQDAKTIDSTGLFLSMWRTAAERGYGVPDRGQFERDGFIFGVSGAAAFYKKAMLEDIREADGYFDPRLRMFYEDLDVAWRANRRGWRAYYVPAARLLHVRGGSFRPDSGIGKAFARRYLNDELFRELIKNRYLTMRKNDGLCGFLVHSIPVLLYDCCAWLHVLIFRPRVAISFFCGARKMFV